MTNKYTRFQIDSLESLVEKHKSDRNELLKIDAALSTRKLRKRNIALRDKISTVVNQGLTRKSEDFESEKTIRDSRMPIISTENISDAIDPRESHSGVDKKEHSNTEAGYSEDNRAIKQAGQDSQIKTSVNSAYTPSNKEYQMTDTEIIYPEGFMSSAFEDMRKKLLDISGSRSRLVNLDHNRRGVVRFVDELPDQLGKTLLSEKAMTVVSVPEPTRELLVEHGYLEWDETSLSYKPLKKDPDAKEWAKIIGLINDYELPDSSDHAADDRHTDLDLQSLLFEPALNVNLKKLASEAKTSIDETGNNILFLSLGFLEWYDVANEGRKRLAPLYMIPVRIEKESIRGVAVYKLKYTGEDIIPNLTLREKLRLDFDLILPSVVDPNDQERLLLPEEYLAEVNALLAKKSNDPLISKWGVRRFGTLATLSLGKLLMYLDLDPSRWPEGEGNLLQHDVIQRFFQDEIRDSVSRSDSDEAYVLDDVPDLHDQFPMIDDADSSQMSVLIDVLKGKSMVVEGPPGTGKSQTITNLIAAAIAQGKSVLFVAEKQAALDVVKRRMDKSGLGDFCLDLHSDKAQKRLVLDSIGARITNQGAYHHSIADYDLQVSRYERARQQLQDYANMVNQPWKGTGLSIHEILSAATRYGQEVSPLTYMQVAPDGITGDAFTRAQLDEQLEQLEVFYSYLDIVSKQLDDPNNWHSHPWYGIVNKQLVSIDHEQIVGLLNDWNEKLTQLTDRLSAECNDLEISDCHYRSLDDIEQLISSWSNIPSLTGTEYLPAFSHIRFDDFSNIDLAIESYKNISDSYKSARSIFAPELIEDLSKVDAVDQAISDLGSLGVDQSKSFDELARAVLAIESTLGLYNDLSIVRSELLSHFGEDIIGLFSCTQQGLHELSLFIQHASLLPSKYIKFRDDIFGDDDLPSALAEIRKRLSTIEREKERLSNIFSLDDLPSAEDLRKHSKTLSETSLLSWMNSAWRQGRNAVRCYSREDKFDYVEMSSALEEAAKWTDSCNEFDHSNEYEDALGAQFEGLKTDCTRIAALSDWYGRVRKDYGIGFGQRVPLAKALFTLSPDIFIGIQNLETDGFTKRIEGFISGLNLLSQVFTGVQCLTSDDVLFNQDDNPLQVLLVNIRKHLQESQGYLLDPNLSQAQLRAAILDLKKLKSSLLELDSLDINARYFDGKFDLVPDKKGHLPKDISVVLTTLDYLKSLYRCTENHDLLAIIVNSNDPSIVNRMINSGAAFNSLFTSVQASEERFMLLSESSRELWFASSGQEYSDVVRRNNLAATNLPWLDGWLKYLFARERMESGGFGKLKQYLTQSDHTLEHVQKVMRFATYQCLANEVYKEQSGLAERSGHEQTALQAQFSKYDNKLKELQRKRVASLATQRKVPAGTSGARVASYSEDYLLHHEIKKKSRNISIRNLVSRAGEAMQAYKPCFMMSPMAVAKYISPDSLRFDLVIMDEASQVKPEYALSCFARGKQVVVVGDPKQLPPTSFFERSVANDGNLWDGDDGNIVDESESILDAVGSQFPNRQLRWHYRSRHESLIEFSNHKFYDSNLVVFPSPWSDSKEYGIKFNYVENGRFLKSVNVPESHAVVAAIREHLIAQTAVRANKDIESLGVVAMNSKQREQIEADLEAAVSADSVFRAAYEKDSQSEDPLFIKNLENVQGDERDVIFISFTYGPQEKGSTSVPQRFGPINGASGWRRLNVLFTRSKKRIQVYSSMTANQILLTENSSLGVKSLKGYLEFAQTGRLVGQTGVAEGEPDSDFEIAVMGALAKEGFECVAQVGVAGFFIDIAVRDPGMPGRYLMGIECDGATYHSSKSTRDRDRVRQSVLEGLDWRIRRIWSTDWFKHPVAELKPIIEELKLLATPIVSGSINDEVAADTSHSITVDTETYLGSASQTLRERLFNFNINVIEKDCPNADVAKRFLRPDMLERLVTDKPTNRDDFIVYIPGYLRTHTCATEAGKYLDDVLEIIADFESSEPEKVA